MTKKTPGGTEKHHESTELESSETAKMFSSFFLSIFLSSDGLALKVVYAQNNTEQCITSSLFHNFEVSQCACNHSKLWLAVWNTICLHAHLKIT